MCVHTLRNMHFNKYELLRSCLYDSLKYTKALRAVDLRTRLVFRLQPCKAQKVECWGREQRLSWMEKQNKTGKEYKHKQPFPDMVACVYNRISWEAKDRGSQTPGPSGLA